MGGGVRKSRTLESWAVRSLKTCTAHDVIASVVKCAPPTANPRT